MAGNLKDSIVEYFAKRELAKVLQRFAKSKEAKMLTGYKTYIVAAVLVLLAALKIIGIEIPGVSETTDPGILITTAFGLVFARNGAKTEVKKIE